MAYDLSPEADAAALKKRRGELHAFAEEITEIVAKMPMPETYLEAERGARAVWVADRVLVRMRVETLGDEEAPSGAARHLPRFAGEEKEGPTTTPSARSPSPTSGEEQEAGGEGWKMPYLMTPVRLRLRNYADRLMEATARLDKPTCYLEGERAQRYALAADRMLGQLYEPVKVAKNAGSERFGDDDDMGLEPERPAYDDLEAWQNLLITKLHKLADERRSQGRTETADAELEAAFGEEKAPLRRCAPLPPRVGEYKEESGPLTSPSPFMGRGDRTTRACALDAVGGAEEGPSVRVVESIFAPSGAFGKRPCGCAISAPKCNGPCPLPP